jgi:hypothetical protein
LTGILKLDVSNLRIDFDKLQREAEFIGIKKVKSSSKIAKTRPALLKM